MAKISSSGITEAQKARRKTKRTSIGASKNSRPKHKSKKR